MSNREAWREELAGALTIEVRLQPGESKTIAILLGSFNTEESTHHQRAAVFISGLPCRKTSSQ